MIDRPIHPFRRDGGVDRLSALLGRFRVSARAVPVMGGIDADGDVDHAILRIVGPASITITADGRPARSVHGPLALFHPRGGDHRVTLPPSDTGEIPMIRADIDLGGPGNPLVGALPDELLITAAEDPALAPLMSVMLAEASAGRCGAGATLDRLCEVALIALFRHAITREPTDRAGLLAGLAHPGLSRALTAMHEAPARPWSLETLSEEAGMSRSAFAATFHETVGMPPATYLTRWRMTLAMRERAAGRALKDIAPLVGYGGVAALSRALARHDGALPPTSPV